MIRTVLLVTLLAVAFPAYSGAQKTYLSPHMKHSLYALEQECIRLLALDWLKSPYVGRQQADELARASVKLMRQTSRSVSRHRREMRACVFEPERIGK